MVMSLLSLSSSSSNSKTLCCCIFVLVALPAVVASSIDGSFETTNDCYQFCKTLDYEKAYWLWCLTRVCRFATRLRQPPKQDKRGLDHRDDVGYRREIPPLLDLIDKRVKEFWEGPAPTDVNH